MLVAARNEADRLPATLAALASAFPRAQVWVADDASKDTTAALARAAGARVHTVARHAGKGGALGATACAALAELGDGAGGRICILCDGDLGASAGALAALAHAVERGEGDLAIAVFARRRGGGLGIAVAFARWAIRDGCGASMVAPLSGQRALRAGAFERLLPLAAGFGMEVGMTIDAVRAGLRVSELELDLGHRVSGRTPAGFAHRLRQLIDCVRAYRARR